MPKWNEWVETQECQHCDKTYTYNVHDEREEWEETYDGGTVTVWVTYCPHCEGRNPQTC
jgi:hypothetical protein